MVNSFPFKIHSSCLLAFEIEFRFKCRFKQQILVNFKFGTCFAFRCSKFPTLSVRVALALIYLFPKVASAYFKGSYSASKGGALSSAPIGSPGSAPTGSPRFENVPKFPKTNFIIGICSLY